MPFSQEEDFSASDAGTQDMGFIILTEVHAEDILNRIMQEIVVNPASVTLHNHPRSLGQY